MKKEYRTRNYISWVALVLSVLSILLWLCKYEPVTWSLFDTILAFLSLVVGILAVMLGYNIFGLKNELKKDIEEKLQDISDHHVIHTATTMIYIEARLLHLATELNNIDDIRQSILMTLDAIEKTKNKEDVDYIINQINTLKSRYGDKLFDETFKGKLRLRLERIGSFSDNALLFLQRFKI
ncbi:hypothetical protein [Bacteroides graminisolvens]|uniref:hypothetical protein n=1 Tax=Bacteroides graminisolvens TaxID=477666 RepID=UPI00240A0176|nr:hypothetical protein [Bacteroides graminisolvens]